MKTDPTDHRTSDGKSPTSVQLLRNPIDFIAEDHLRLRTMCAEMDRLANATGPEADAIEGLFAYLTQELPALLADEDDDLMPLVLNRAEPEDELPRLARRLAKEHREIETHLREVVAGLVAVPGATTVADRLRDPLRCLAAATRRHLILENAILLPLARVRLRSADLDTLRKAMLRRRGLQDLFVV
jgi:iron-sulfur cluster repair protein YtfE (RIC family)